MFNVYEVDPKTEKKWFYKQLGNDRFDAYIEFSHLLTDWLNGHHLTLLVLIED